MKISRFKKLRSIVAMLLVLVMMAGMLPTSVYAAVDSGSAGSDNVGSGVVVDVGTTEGGGDESQDDASPTGDNAGDGGSVADSNDGDNADDDGNVAGDDGQQVTDAPTPVPDGNSTGDDGTSDIPDAADSDGDKDVSDDDPYPLPEGFVENPEPAWNEGSVSMKKLYGSEENRSAYELSLGRRIQTASLQLSGTITTGNDYGYYSKWLSSFAPYTSCKVKYFNGYPAYCIEPHKSTPGDGNTVSASSYWGSAELRLALAYGLGGVDDSTLIWYADGYRDYAWLATQEVIWEIVGGYNDLSDLFCGPNHAYDPEVAVPVKAAHDYIRDMMDQQDIIPSFAVGRPTQTYNDIELAWNGSVWTKTVKDTNYVLPNFEDFTFGLSGLTASRSGYNLTITATSTAAKSMLNGYASYASEGNVIDADDVNSYLLESSSSSIQDCNKGFRRW